MSRRAAAILALISLALTLFAGHAMSERIAGFNAGRTRHVFRAISVREFTYAGRPSTIRDEVDADGRRWVAIRYGEAERRIPVPPSASIDEREASLARHQEWLKVLRFVPLTGSSAADIDRRIDAGELKDRLAVVARQGPETGDAMADLDAFRKRPTFLFVEFLEAGGLAETSRWFNIAPEPLGPEADRLVEGTWEYDAALSVRPLRGKPKPKFSDNAVGSLGWTLPVAFLSMLTLSISLAFAFVRRAPAPTGTPT